MKLKSIIGIATIATIISVRRKMKLGPCSMELDDKYRNENNKKVELSVEEAYKMLKKDLEVGDIVGFINTENSDEYLTLYLFVVNEPLITLGKTIYCIDKIDGRKGKITGIRVMEILHNFKVQEIKDVISNI